ncbi:MFS transporter [Roseomonas gilardii]|uniref:MFS transporter n=1 Tax=Roseomonas gilardii TaxID=257708 RepID=UPI001C930B49|nr:MFS transporter [Roseomonas gilardii]
MSSPSPAAHAPPARPRQAVLAAVIGNVLEWYDFGVYAFVATILARKFFPPEDDVTAQLSVFLAYGLGFLARPLGGVVIGRLGDTRGRRTALLVTMLLMAVGTVLIGLLPTYAAIGLAAPVLLVLARLVQGFSAGGEWGSSTTYIVEWAPAGRRGYYGSFQQVSTVAGLLLGSAVGAGLNSLLTPEQMNDWGWRVPFLLGGILGPVGLWMRRTMQETPAYEQAAAAPSPAHSGARSPFRLALAAFGFTIVWTVCFYVLLSYIPTWTQRYVGVSPSAALWANTVGLLVLVVCIPLMGALSDRIGRRPLLLLCCLAVALLPYPAFRFLAGGASLGGLMLVQAVFAVVIAMFSGPGPAAIAEIFPTRSRSTWMTTGYALSVALFGGFAPAISVWLIDRFQSPVAHSFYLIAAALVSAATIWRLRETAHRALD